MNKPHLIPVRSVRVILCVCLMFVLPVAHGGVYKWVDADGGVHFSDQPVPGAEQIELTPTQTYAAPPPPPVTITRSPTGGEEAVDQEQLAYTSLAIVQPTEDEAFRANNGNVSVKLSLNPALQKGHSVALELDGHRIASRANTSFVLQDVPRGTHRLQALVVDAQGAEKIRATAVSFHVLRTSAPPKPGK